MKRVMICSGVLLLLLQMPAAASEVLTLPDCLNLARESNALLISARHQPLQAGNLLSQARSSYLPSVDLRAGYTAQLQAQAIVTPAGSQQTQDERYLSAGLSADQLLYDFGRTDSRVRAATAQVGAAEATVRAVEQEVLFQTIQTYYRILQYQHQLAAAQSEVDAVTDHRRAVQALFDEGMVTRNDLLQAEVRLTASRQQELEWENRLANTRLQLNKLINKPADFRPELSAEPLAAPLANADFSPEHLAGRPDLQRAREQVEASIAETRAVRGHFWPQLFARAEANYVENSRVKEQTIYAATIGVRGNLFDGYATTSTLRRALEEEALRRDQLADLQQGAELEYRSALNDLTVAEARIAALATAIAQAEENLRLNQVRYREQVGTATEVLDAQTLLTETRSSYYRALYDREIAQAYLSKAQGKL